jgi:hypothetical protein
MIVTKLQTLMKKNSNANKYNLENDIVYRKKYIEDI